jgi:hypothetical protein
MDFEVAGACVRFVALPARVGLGTSVNELVAFPVRILFKRPWAVLAPERLLAGMGPHVDLCAKRS